MKYLLFLAIQCSWIFSSINSNASPEGKAPQIEFDANELEKIQTMAKEVKILSSGNQTEICFIKGVDVLLRINKLIRTSRRPFRNISFVGRSGIVYDSGISPDSISDLEDRKIYKDLIAENERDIGLWRSALDLRRDISKILQECSQRMPGKEKEHAESIVMLLME